MLKTLKSCAGISDPWDTRFGFFWYNDREIFHSTQDDLNRQAETLADAGINHVITFSCTHFRWSFRRHWDLITETIAKIVKACHLHGICLTEHHSSHAIFTPRNAEDEHFMERVLQVRGSAMGSWPYLREDCDADPIIDGAPLSSFRQIDGRTGKLLHEKFTGMCFNNPDYRRAYLSYLETLYAVGIDGIMTDDVTFFGFDACACEHCRRLFREQTGYELPEPGPDWEACHSDYENPSFLSWLNFRFRAIENFHAAVKTHYDDLGLRPLRPNYVSTILNGNLGAYAMETVPDLDWVFQECCYSFIIRYSWPAWGVEAAHRFTVGRRRDIPPMAMSYPDRPDTLLFTWGLAMSWGGLFLCTPEGYAVNEREKELRTFEQRHARLLRNPQRISRIGLYDSKVNRELYCDAVERSLCSLKSWSQACYRQNVQFDLFQREELGRLDGYRVVVLNEAALLDEEEIEGFKHFVENGGALVWVGRTATRDGQGMPRPGKSFARIWAIPGAVEVRDGGSIHTFEVGKGKLIVVPGDYGLGPLEKQHGADRWLKEEEVRVPFQAVSEDEKKVWKQITDILVGLLPISLLRICLRM